MSVCVRVCVSLATSHYRVDCDTAINTKDTSKVCRVNTGLEKCTQANTAPTQTTHTDASLCFTHTHTHTVRAVVLHGKHAHIRWCLLCGKSWVPFSFNQGSDCSEHKDTQTQEHTHTVVEVKRATRWMKWELHWMDTFFQIATTEKECWHPHSCLFFFSFHFHFPSSP